MNSRASLRWTLLHLLAGGALFAAAPARADLWRWVDAQGNVNITQDPGEIPQEYRDKATAVTQKKEGADAPSEKGAKTGESAAPESKRKPQAAPGGAAAVEPARNPLANDRAYWEGRAKEIKLQIKEQEDKIAELRATRSKATQQYAHTLRQMRMGTAEAEKKIESLRKQLTIDLPAEARAVGANPEWVK